MTDVWILTMVRTPEEGMTPAWHIDFGGAGSLDDLTDGLRRNAGDVWDNWYPFAALERMPSAIVVPCSTARETRWFAMHCPDGTYSTVTAIPCEAPSDLPTDHALCSMLGKHDPVRP